MGDEAATVEQRCDVAASSRDGARTAIAKKARETKAEGVEGKASLWTTLRELRGRYPELLSSDLDDLLQRAQRQRQVSETERIAAARRSLTTDVRRLNAGPGWHDGGDVPDLQ